LAELETVGPLKGAPGTVTGLPQAGHFTDLAANSSLIESFFWQVVQVNVIMRFFQAGAQLRSRSGARVPSSATPIAIRSRWVCFMRVYLHLRRLPSRRLQLAAIELGSGTAAWTT
jgi:hypothetical protein